GWTKAAESLGTVTHAIFTKVAVGNEDGTSVSFTIGTGVECAAHVYRVAAGTYTGSIVISTVATGAGPSVPNATAVSFAGRGLFITTAAGQLTAGLTTPPSGYTGTLSNPGG